MADLPALLGPINTVVSSKLKSKERMERKFSICRRVNFMNFFRTGCCRSSELCVYSDNRRRTYDQRYCDLALLSKSCSDLIQEKRQRLPVQLGQLLKLNRVNPPLPRLQPGHKFLVHPENRRHRLLTEARL